MALDNNRKVLFSRSTGTSFLATLTAAEREALQDHLSTLNNVSYSHIVVSVSSHRRVALNSLSIEKQTSIDRQDITEASLVGIFSSLVRVQLSYVPPISDIVPTTSVTAYNEIHAFLLRLWCAKWMADNCWKEGISRTGWDGLSGTATSENGHGMDKLRLELRNIQRNLPDILHAIRSIHNVVLSSVGDIWNSFHGHLQHDLIDSEITKAKSGTVLSLRRLHKDYVDSLHSHLRVYVEETDLLLAVACGAIECFLSYLFRYQSNRLESTDLDAHLDSMTRAFKRFEESKVAVTSKLKMRSQCRPHHRPNFQRFSIDTDGENAIFIRQKLLIILGW